MRPLTLNQLTRPHSKQRSHGAGKEIDRSPVVGVRAPEDKSVNDGPDIRGLGQKRTLRSWKHYKQRPMADENQDRNHRLPAKSQLHDQVAKKISNSDLRQHVDELEVQPAVSYRDQDLAHQDQTQTPCNYMPEELASGSALFYTP